ncbi:MAG: carbohydrate ABC transporter permease [Planctomycetes bacterium]|nr:carbohydrate ABC transporter permease [Planctomycetota bacterium]
MSRGRYWALVPLAFGALLMLFPLWWMLVVSLETPAQAGAATVEVGALELLPSEPQWHNYADAAREVGSVEWQGFLDALANSILVTFLTVLFTVLSCSLVGYALARIRFRGRGALFGVMLATMMLPPQVTMIPMFLVFRSLGWVDTILPLVVPALFGNAFFIFMFRQFMAQVPESLVEAARLDGCGHLEVWWRVMLPLCRPVIAITAVFTFIFVWNDFLGPLIYLHSERKATLAVALNSFRNQFGGLEDVQYLMALSLITMIPCILLFLVAQRQFVEGLGKGAVKG